MSKKVVKVFLEEEVSLKLKDDAKQSNKSMSAVLAESFSSRKGKKACSLSKLASFIESARCEYVWHTSLSVNKNEKLTDEEWKQIGKTYLKKMDFGKNQYVIFRHTDAEHHHIHIVANRISTLDGETVSDSRKRSP